MVKKLLFVCWNNIDGHLQTTEKGNGYWQFYKRTINLTVYLTVEKLKLSTYSML